MEKWAIIDKMPQVNPHLKLASLFSILYASEAIKR